MSDFVDIKIVSSEEQFSDAMSVRRQVFVDEQKISADLEFDGNDFGATHILAYVDDEPVGTMRIRYFKDFVKFERACVIKPFRKSNISELMMQTGLQFSAQKGYDLMYGMCKEELLSRWAQDNILPIEGAKEVSQNGMKLIPIAQQLPKAPYKIDRHTPFDVLLKKEGSWFDECLLEGKKPLVINKRIKHLADMTQTVYALKQGTATSKAIGKSSQKTGAVHQSTKRTQQQQYS
ncbi:MAG: hypothetical protein J6X42_03010 [Alphaproteobacteria bacterium]|nr:hypothetical protein [Alphaproteobacteria bacterium]